MTEGTTRHQFVRTGFDNLGRNLKIAGQYGVAHRLVDMPLFEQPVARHCMEFFLFLLGLTAQMLAQYLAQQRVEAVPGFPVVALDLGDEQVIAVEAGQLAHHPGNRVRLANKPGAQGGGEAIADRRTRQQLPVFEWQVDQHLLLEVLRKGPGASHLHTIDAAAVPGFQVDSEQLQASHPTVGQVMQGLGIVSADLAKLSQVSF
ncbi:hypothetical protein D9M73_179660 [compost metagenome]